MYNSAQADLDRIRLAMEEQGKMLVSVTSRMHNAEERKVKSLKRTARREDQPQRQRGLRG